MKKYGVYIVMAAILLGAAGFILHNGCMTGAVSNAWSLKWTKKITASIDKKALAQRLVLRKTLVGYSGKDVEKILEQVDLHALVRKAGHVLEYACFGIILGVICFFVRCAWYWKLLGLAAALWPIPLLDEWFQSFVDRTSSMSDVYLDVFSEIWGISLAFSIFGFVYVIFLRSGKKQKKEGQAPATKKA